MAKLFISYNHQDKLLVDTIARRLELEFGRNNIFYDAWSMQPGDSIIGKMNEGLEGFDTFFLFMSPNSLTSNMVKLEWRTALNRAVNNNLKFVIVRIADCRPPVILSDMLYIDLYGDGLDGAVEKMKKVAKLENCYTPLDDIENYKVDVAVLDKTTAIFTIRTIHFAEHNPQFSFACENDLSEFSVKPTSEAVAVNGTGTLAFDDGSNFNMYTIGLQRVLKPGFPFVVELKSDNISKLRNISVNVLLSAETNVYRRLKIEGV